MSFFDLASSILKISDVTYEPSYGLSDSIVVRTPLMRLFLPGNSPRRQGVWMTCSDRRRQLPTDRNEEVFLELRSRHAFLPPSPSACPPNAPAPDRGRWQETVSGPLFSSRQRWHSSPGDVSSVVSEQQAKSFLR